MSNPTLRLTDAGGRIQEGDTRTVHKDRWGITNMTRGGVPPTPVKVRRIKPRPDLVKPMTPLQRRKAFEKWLTFEKALDAGDRARGDM